MFTQPTEMFQVYVDELQKYCEWTNGRKAVYGKGSHPMESWDNRDYARVNEWNAELRAMERVLGLTEQEITAAGESVGMDSAAQQ